MAVVCAFSVYLVLVVCFLFLGVNKCLCDNPYTLLCVIDGFDYFNLTVVTWFISLGQEHCLPLNHMYSQSQCTLDMAICHSFGTPGPCQDSSVCSVSDQGYLSLGAYTENPLGPLATPNSDDGFHAVFQNGSQYRTASSNFCLLQTNINFLCNMSATWAVPNISESRMKAPDPKFLSYNNQTCQLNLTFDFAGACKIKALSGENMSPGTVLIIIFLVSVILYFALGSMINLARGKVGADAIPHSQFWTMLPVYIIDGFQFVLCCGRLPATATYEQI